MPFKKLVESIAARDEAGIKELLSTHPEVLDQTDEHELSGYMHLAYSGFPELERKARSLKQHFSFYEAIVAGKVTLAKEVLKEHPELINTPSPDGFSPIALACYFNHSDLAIALLFEGANPDQKAKNPSKVNALHAAVARENLELCQKLLEAGADVNATQTQGVTALHSAVHRGNLQLVLLLLNHGADITLSMENGDTPTDIAHREGHKEIEKLLETN